MLTNVNFYNRFWRDNKVKQLSSNGKYLFSYMITSPYNNELGLYYMPLALVAHDTGLNENTVKVEMNKLIEASLVKYDYQNEMVFVVNFLRFNNQENSISVKEVESILENLPETYLIKDFLESVIVNKLSYINEDVIINWKENFQPIIRGFNMGENPVETVIVQEEPANIEPATIKNVEIERVEDKFEDKLDEKVDNLFDGVVETDELKSIKEENKDDVARDDETDDEKIVTKTKSKSPTESEKKELGIVFKEIWKMYPKKQNVTGARKNFINMVVKKGVSVLTLKNAVKNYAKYVEDNKIEPTYIILGSNFFGRSERYAEFTDEAMGNNKETTLSEVEENQVKTSFERFWQAYPKKEGKELAYKNFLHIYINKENTLEELIRSAEKYASDCFVKHKENQFIKKASSFLDLEIRPYRDFIDFTNTPSMNVAPTTDYAIPVVNQPVYDAPIVSTQEFKNEENTPVENAPFEISSIVPQPLEDDDEDDDDYSSVENQEPNTEAPVSSQTFVANDEDINDEETPW